MNSDSTERHKRKTPASSEEFQDTIGVLLKRLETKIDVITRRTDHIRNRVDVMDKTVEDLRNDTRFMRSFLVSKLAQRQAMAAQESQRQTQECQRQAQESQNIPINPTPDVCSSHKS